MYLKNLREFDPPLKVGEKVQFLGPYRPDKPVLIISEGPYGKVYAKGKDFSQRLDLSTKPYYRRVTPLYKPLEDYL